MMLRELQSLRELEGVGDVRGLGLFAGVEFVRDKATKTPFDPRLKLNARVGARCLENGLIVYPGGGGADGVHGDHVLLAPPFVINEDQIRDLVEILKASISQVMQEPNLG